MGKLTYDDGSSHYPQLQKVSNPNIDFRAPPPPLQKTNVLDSEEEAVNKATNPSAAPNLHLLNLPPTV
jgi:hypothetical protein